jgi:hypothetical protein
MLRGCFASLVLQYSSNLVLAFFFYYLSLSVFKDAHGHISSGLNHGEWWIGASKGQSSRQVFK